MMNNVLVVDNDQAMLRSLTSLLQSQGGFLNVLSATHGSQALTIMRKMPVRIVITAIRVPEVDGFELVARLAREYPATKVIVMTNESKPLLRARIKQFPSAVYLDQTHDLSMLTKRVFTELQIDYGGQVRGINLSSFLQMMALETRSCTLKVSSKDQFGFLWLEQGELIAARNAEKSGKDAALQILAWKNVFIDIDYAPRQIKREISIPLMMLILESGQLDDEMRSESTNHRQHERYELLVALDFDIEQMTRHCYLRDISLGGAYIETDHDIGIGESITLSLSSPVLRSNCSVDATVVRKDSRGIGILFKLSGPHQGKMIQAMIDGSLALPPSHSNRVEPYQGAPAAS
ncbi:response regulator [Desulfopila aestuarii]|uniref:PilZ domain-containing protein n=1 Tax=Desulfopila aestuarii DSM 18488 TaxID=1121416 RepID=A0A1M7Y2Y6_9BACT|nr:response regulator [Desulfopila aestuarii]SHO46341.1 PilZ domain-containing protein [Desulfopila aestuarii DSM 18488]